MKAAILTVSDSCAEGLRPDLTGPALTKMLSTSDWEIVESCIVPDEISAIRAAICRLSHSADLLMSAGGTGVSPRDVTPEAVAPLLEKQIPGLAELMRLRGLEETEFSVLSRSLAGVLNQALVLCLPGSVRGATQSLQAVLKLLPHAIELLRGQTEHTDKGPL